MTAPVPVTQQMLTALPTGTLHEAIKVLQGSAHASSTLAAYIVRRRHGVDSWEVRAAELRAQAVRLTAVVLVLQAELDRRSEP